MIMPRREIIGPPVMPDSVRETCSTAATLAATTTSYSLPPCSSVGPRSPLSLQQPQFFHPRAQWFQTTAFRDFTIYSTFFIMMIISSASPAILIKEAGLAEIATPLLILVMSASDLE